MNEVNSMYNSRNETIIGGRAKRLKEARCDLIFVRPCRQNAKRNLVLSGGRELPQIVGEILKHYFWIGEATVAYSPIYKAIEHLSSCNSADYEFEDTAAIYKRKVSGLLYDMFTGMRLGRSWDGRSSVNGGYIVMKGDGDVLAYHTCIADEFKEFLLNRLALETPSASRHRYMQVYKENDRYYIKFNLQIRFS